MRIDLDDTLGLIHSIDTTAANVHDIVPTGKLLHGEEQRAFGEAGCLGIQKREEYKHRKTSPGSLRNALAPGSSSMPTS